MDKFTEQVTDFLSERKQAAISALRRDNPQYAELRQAVEAIRPVCFGDAYDEA